MSKFEFFRLTHRMTLWIFVYYVSVIVTISRDDRAVTHDDVDNFQAHAAFQWIFLLTVICKIH